MLRPFGLTLFFLIGNLGYTQAQSTAEAEAEVVTDVEFQYLQTIVGYTSEQISEYRELKEALAIDFTNILLEEQSLFRQHKEIGKQELRRNNFIGGYYYLLEANAIYPSDPDVSSLIGSVMLDTRSFGRAEVKYRYAVKVEPLNINFRYNLGECLMVQKKYAEALEQFDIAIKMAEVYSSNIKSILQFKLLLCHLGLHQTSSDEKALHSLKNYQLLSEEINENIYTVPYYYAKMVKAYLDEDEGTAKKWQNYARHVYPNENVHRRYVDALIEFGFVSSYYGSIAEKNSAVLSGN